MTPTDQLKKGLVQLRTRYAKSPLPGFFSWWGGELFAFLPERWRTVLGERGEAMLLERSAGELVLWRQSGNRISEHGRIALELTPEQQQDNFSRLRNAVADPNLRVYFCISRARTLHRNLWLPTAAEDNLRQVLAFEMDRQTPFKADQVYFDYQAGARDAAGRNLSVDLTVVPRGVLDNELAALATTGAVLDGVDCWRDQPGSGRAGLNLLPHERRAKRRDMRLRLNLALAAAAILLLLVVMVQSLSNRAQAVAAMTEEVDKANKEAKQVADLRRTLQDTITSANFLSRKKAETPNMVALLDDLSRRLPDDTFLERLNVDEKGKLEIQGQSAVAAKLIDTLKQSDVLADPSFQGQIQPDPRTKKERFDLIAQLRPRDSNSDKPAIDATKPKSKPDAAAKGEANAPDAGSK